MRLTAFMISKGVADSAVPTMKASQFNDLEAGNRLELDWLTGKVVALGLVGARFVCGHHPEAVGGAGSEAGYSGKPRHEKLGFRPGMATLFVALPANHAVPTTNSKFPPS